MNYFSLVAFFLTFLFISCQPEPIVVPDYGRKITINGLLTNEEEIELNINKSLIITDSNYFVSLNTSKIYLFEDGIYIDTLKSTAYKLYFDWGVNQLMPYSDFLLSMANISIEPVFFHNELRLYPGRKYKIVANYPKLDIASAEIILPVPVSIEKVDTLRIPLPQNTEEWQSKFKFNCQLTFTDPVETHNFYLIFIKHKVYYENGFIHEDNLNAIDPEVDVSFTSNDPIIEEPINHGTIPFGVAFTDKSMNGETYKISLEIESKEIGPPFSFVFHSDENHRNVLQFKLYNITEDYYKYIQTLNRFYENYKNPLAEQTEVYSNIEGGFGILGGAAVSCDSLVFTY